MKSINPTYIPNELRSAVPGGAVTGADMVKDRTNYPDNPKTQAEINAELIAEIEAIRQIISNV